MSFGPSGRWFLPSRQACLGRRACLFCRPIHVVMIVLVEAPVQVVGSSGSSCPLWSLGLYRSSSHTDRWAHPGRRARLCRKTHLDRKARLGRRAVRSSILSGSSGPSLLFVLYVLYGPSGSSRPYCSCCLVRLGRRACPGLWANLGRLAYLDHQARLERGACPGRRARLCCRVVQVVGLVLVVDLVCVIGSSGRQFSPGCQTYLNRQARLGR